MTRLENTCISKILVLCCLFFFSENAVSQINVQTQQNEFWSHVRFGGGIGLSFGDGFFSGTLAPSAIYQFDDKFAAGVGLNGTYSRLKGTYKSTVLGGSILGLYNVIPEIQLSAEFEELSISRHYDGLDSLNYTETYWYPALFIGVGFRSENFTIGVRYDVLFDDDRSIYASAFAPFIRVYF